MAEHSAKTTWRDGMTFDTVVDDKVNLSFVLSSGFEDPEEAKHGMAPVAMVLAGLAGCTAMDVISILKKKRQEVTSFEVHVEGEQAGEHPRVYEKVTIVYRVRGAVTEEALARAIELSMTKYCPVSAMVREVAEIDYRYEIVG